MIDHGDTWTAGQLIEQLQEYDPQTPVISEGCDCYGAVLGIQARDDGLVLTRQPVGVGAEGIVDPEFAIEFVPASQGGTA